MPFCPIFWVTILVGLVPLVKGHGCLTKVVANSQTACAVHAQDPVGCVSTNNLKIRELIARSGNTGDCANPPGCEASFNCDWCGLEKIRTFAPLIGSKWWTGMPAAHWDNPAVLPQFPCMSKGAFGANGKMTIKPGDSVAANFYINADHSGLYRYQLACGNVADNALFEPLTDWLALHKSKDGATLPDSRIVGSTRTQTDAYYAETTCTGGACSYRMNRGVAPPQDCGGNLPDCLLTDTFVIPSSTQCRGDAILRWLWNSAEGPETYANCLDLNIVDSGVTAPTGSAPTTSPPIRSPTTPSPTTTYVPNTGDWGCTTRWALGSDNCMSKPLCCPGGTSCWEKNANWAHCETTCATGIRLSDPPLYQTPWSCNNLGVAYPMEDGHGTVGTAGSDNYGTAPALGPDSSAAALSAIFAVFFFIEYCFVFGITA